MQHKIKYFNDMSERAYYKIKIETTKGTFYVSSYYNNKYVVKISLSRKINCAETFRGHRISGPGVEDDSLDVYGNPPNYTPSATVYASLKDNEWFISHKSIFNDKEGKYTIEEDGKKRTKKYHGIKGKKIELSFEI